LQPCGRTIAAWSARKP